MSWDRQETLDLHRRMWTDMKKELGDNPSGAARYEFKKKWCIEHVGRVVFHACFLCEYNDEQKVRCNECLIDWEPIAYEEGLPYYDCMDEYRNCSGTIYEVAPISEILALPEK